MGKAPRLSLYRAKIELDDFGTRMNLDLLKDSKKMYLIVTDPDTHIKKEMELYLKQATQVLMYCKNDFRRFVGEILCIKHNIITLRDINRVIENLANQNLQMQSTYFAMQDVDESEQQHLDHNEEDGEKEQEAEVWNDDKQPNDLSPSVKHLPGTIHQNQEAAQHAEAYRLEEEQEEEEEV